MVAVFVCVCTYTGDIITRCVDVPVGILFEYVSYHTVLCLLVAGYLEIKNRLPPMSVFTK